MLYLLQTSFNPPRGHFQCKAVTNDKKLQWLIYRKIPKRNYIQVACSILINNSLPQVSLIPSFFIFCNKCLLFPTSCWCHPYLHQVLQCLPSHHSFSPWGSKMIQLVLDRVWFEFNGKSQSKLMENPSSWNLDLDVQLGVVQNNLVKYCTKPEIKLFFDC